MKATVEATFSFSGNVRSGIAGQLPHVLVSERPRFGPQPFHRISDQAAGDRAEGRSQRRDQPGAHPRVRKIETTKAITEMIMAQMTPALIEEVADLTVCTVSESAARLSPNFMDPPYTHANDCTHREHGRKHAARTSTDVDERRAAHSRGPADGRGRVQDRIRAPRDLEWHRQPGPGNAA